MNISICMLWRNVRRSLPKPRHQAASVYSCARIWRPSFTRIKRTRTCSSGGLGSTIWLRNYFRPGQMFHQSQGICPIVLWLRLTIFFICKNVPVSWQNFSVQMLSCRLSPSNHLFWIIFWVTKVCSWICFIIVIFINNFTSAKRKIFCCSLPIWNESVV